MLLPSHRTKPRVPDRRDDLLLGHPEGHSCGRHYVLLHHRAPVVVPAEEEPDLGDLRPHRHPRHLDRADVPENDPRDGQHAEVADRVAEPRYPTLPEPGVAGKERVSGLEGPGDERGEASRLLLEFPDADQVGGDVLRGLHAAEHHRGGGGQPLPVRLAHHPSPLTPADFPRADHSPYLVVENLRAATGEGVQAGLLQPKDRLGDGNAGPVREVTYFRRGEAMESNGMSLYLLYQPDRFRKSPVGMQTPPDGVGSASQVEQRGFPEEENRVLDGGPALRGPFERVTPGKKGCHAGSPSGHSRTTLYNVSRSTGILPAWRIMETSAATVIS